MTSAKGAMYMFVLFAMFYFTAYGWTAPQGWAQYRKERSSGKAYWMGLVFSSLIPAVIIGVLIALGLGETFGRMLIYAGILTGIYIGSGWLSGATYKWLSMSKRNDNDVFKRLQARLDDFIRIMAIFWLFAIFA